MKKVAIDLTWVRHEKVGGTESCILNLLDGFMECPQSDLVFYLLVSKNNSQLFHKYGKAGVFEIIVCNIVSKNRFQRILWQNFVMCRLLRKKKIYICLEPIYSMPFIRTKGIKFITTIHDLQAIHYPEYFSKARVLWMKSNWRNSVRSSSRIVTVSQYVKEDILLNFKVQENKVIVIYDSVEIDQKDTASNEKLKVYGVKPFRYYFTVSSLLPHKNLATLIRAIARLKETESFAFYPLIISGVGGKSRPELEALITENRLDKEVILTKYIDNAQRNMLYKNCRAFLYPSIFEGFGMPPVEAMLLGAPAITTREASIPEVTQNKAIYVKAPFDDSEWADKMEKLSSAALPATDDIFHDYRKSRIAEKYIALFMKV